MALMLPNLPSPTNTTTTSTLYYFASALLYYSVVCFIELRGPI
jgi:hypothetical protein